MIQAKSGIVIHFELICGDESDFKICYNSIKRKKYCDEMKGVKIEPLHDMDHPWWRTRRSCLVPAGLDAQLSSRPLVWGVGLWPDNETERLAKVCAGELAEQLGLKCSSFIPEDSISFLKEIIGDENIEDVFLFMEAATGKAGEWTSIDFGQNVTFRDVVLAIKAGKPKHPVNLKPEIALSTQDKLVFSMIWLFGLVLAMIATEVVLRRCGIVKAKSLSGISLGLVGTIPYAIVIKAVGFWSWVAVFCVSCLAFSIYWKVWR